MSFPKHKTPDDLANDFGNFFTQKINNFNQSINTQNPLEILDAGKRSALILVLCGGVTFANFEALTQGQVAELIKKAA